MFKRFIGCIFALHLSGCGTYTPDIQEFWGTSDDSDEKVQLVVSRVKCELVRAAQLVERGDIDNQIRSSQGRQLEWLNTWGADVALFLTVDEKSTLSPGLSLNTPLANNIKMFPGAASLTTAQSYATGLGGSLSSDAYRQDKVHIFYKFSDLIGPDKNLPTKDTLINRSCIKPNASGTLFLDTDLKLYDWIRTVTNLQETNSANFKDKDSFAATGVISHEVKFEIVSTGSVTPTWKLVRVSANSGTTLFNASRDRTQDLIVTLGPASDGTLSQKGQNSALASEIGAAIVSAINRVQ